MTTPFADLFAKTLPECSTCGKDLQAIKNLMEDKPQTFVVQVLVEAVDGLAITRESLAKGKVLSVSPHREQPRPQFNVTGQNQNTVKQAFPANRPQPALNG